MGNSNLFQRTKIHVFRRCTHANFRFLNHISSFLKPTAMKRLGTAHNTIFDIAMTTQACRNYQERRSILVSTENWREKIQSPQSVCSPLYAAPLSFFLRTWDFITKSRITTWVFPKNCILGTSTEHKMWPEIQHLQRVHVPKTSVLALRNTLELSIVSENKDRLLGSPHTNSTEVFSVRCPYEKPISSWVGASGLSLEGRCTLVENVCNSEIIPSPLQCTGFSPLYRSFPDKRQKLRLRWRVQAQCTRNGENLSAFRTPLHSGRRRVLRSDT